MNGRKLALVAFVGALAAWSAGAEESPRSNNVLATPPPYPFNRADDVRRPGFNGREWIGRPVIGGVDTGYPAGWKDPGPAAYGAEEQDGSRVWITVGTERLSINPWEGYSEGGLSRLERGRNQWLAQNGFVGGVRTFTNDSLRYGVLPMTAAHIEPRASFEWPIDQPRFQRRQQVHNEQGAAPAFVLRAGDRVSWPMGAPADAMARAERKTAGEVARAD